MYDMKALYQAKSVADAVALRLAHPEAQIIAGGSDVLVQMREGKRAGVELISIYGLDELRGVTLEDDGTHIQKRIKYAGACRNDLLLSVLRFHRIQQSRLGADLLRT